LLILFAVALVSFFVEGLVSRANDALLLHFCCLGVALAFPCSGIVDLVCAAFAAHLLNAVIPIQAHAIRVLCCLRYVLCAIYELLVVATLA
jgi:hypothetical protein